LILALALTPAAGCSANEGESARECTDQVDNDLDGTVDCEDTGCCGTWICGVHCEGGDDDDSAGR